MRTYSKIKKISIIIAIIIIINVLYPSASIYAWSGIIQSGRDFTRTADTQMIGDMQAGGAQGQLQQVSRQIYVPLMVIAIILATIIGTIIGIKIMIASVDEKAKAKEALIPFVIGCMVAFGAFTIWRMAMTIGTGIVA
ncbi:MAG: hypothetical protein FWC68_01420 [Oscillospiraceae bacterium]|nr:hypothetical protein [Oscillospiraceae bacterium]